MDSNTHSTRRRARLAALTAEIDAVLAEDLDGLTDAALAQDTQELRKQVDRLEGGWLKHLAAVDARGAAGADQDRQFGSTASWLRTRLRMTATAAATAVRTARVLFWGAFGVGGGVVCWGASAAHAAVLAPAPCTWLTTPSTPPNQPCWRRPAARTHRAGSGRHPHRGRHRP
jgi:hypothetical protein